METNIKGNGLMAKKKEKELKSKEMDRDMKENGKKEIQRKGFSSLEMDLSISDSLNVTIDNAKEFTFLKTVGI